MLLAVLLVLLQVPVHSAEKNIDEAAQEVIDRFSRYDVQWVGDWESSKDLAPVYLGEGVFKKVQKSGEVHLIDASGKLLNNLGKNNKWRFETFKNGYCRFMDENYNYGFINNKGKVVVQPFSRRTGDFSEGLCVFEDPKTDLYGYIDGEGKVVIQPVFFFAEAFKNGVAKVQDANTNGWGYINTKGSYVVSPEYDFLPEYSDWMTVGKLIETSTDMYELYGVIDKNGKVIIDVKYRWLSDSSDSGLISAQNDANKYGFIDKTGNTVIPFQYTDAGSFSEGLAYVRDDKGKYGYIDRTGKTVIPFTFDVAKNFSEGLAAVFNGKYDSSGSPLYGYINTAGQIVIPMEVPDAGEFRAGIAVCRPEYAGRKTRIIDRTGKVLFEMECSEFKQQNDLFKYRVYNYSTSPMMDKYGYVDLSGKELTAGSFYTYMGDFKEGLCAYTRLVSNAPDSKSVAGFADHTFTFVLEDPNLTSVSDFDNGAAAITVQVTQGNEKRYRTGLLRNPLSQIMAVPTKSKVLVNGKQVNVEAYGINGNNYFKLRDLAKLVSGTKKQFEVTWDGQKKAINLVSGKPYTVVGGELAAGDGKQKTCTLNLSKVYRDGNEIYLRAYTINGNNYFKLRDVAKAFNIGITYDAATGTIGINTDQPYTD